jgi:hypothetical protein
VRKVQVSAAIMCLVASPAFAAETIGAFGAERCSKASKGYAVDLLAPETADVEARAKGILVTGAEGKTIGLSVDGKPCSAGRCAFRATKGQTYKFSAESPTEKVDSVCISVSRAGP